jgi:hypothetical protein
MRFDAFDALFQAFFWLAGMAPPTRHAFTERAALAAMNQVFARLSVLLSMRP